MTMETYHWERKHQSDPPITVSITRTLPEGNWTVRSEETNLPPEFPTRYDTPREAMAAADEMAKTHFRHDCAPRGCGDWLPVPPTHNVSPETMEYRGPEGEHWTRSAPANGWTRPLASGVVGALTLTAVHELARRKFEHAPRMDQVAMKGLRRILSGDQRDPSRLHQVALAGDLVANSLYYAAIPAATRKETWIRAAVLGTAAGLGALLLPQRMGLGAPQQSDRRPNQFMTVGWYLAGAMAAALVATRMRA